MNSLHKKRQSYRQTLRSKTIQQLFARKRQQLLDQLKVESIDEQANRQYGLRTHTHSTTVSQLLDSHPSLVFSNIRTHLTTNNQPICIKDQQLLFVFLTSNKHQMDQMQKCHLLTRLINREEFFLNEEVQKTYGWKNVIADLLAIVNGNVETIRGEGKSVMMNENIHGSYDKHRHHYQQNVNRVSLLNSICLALIKIWQLKPKTQLFLMLSKSYPTIRQQIPGPLSLTLIAELSYDPALLPSYSFIMQLMQTTFMHESEVKFFRTLEILKNFISHFKVQNNHYQLHPRQLVFEYLNWIKTQVNFLLADENTHHIKQQKHEPKLTYSTPHHLTTQTRYFLVYLLFTVLNKLSQINENERQYLQTKEILILNEQLLNFKENHTLMKFLIFEGKQSTDPHHKKNIFRTLSFLIGFLETTSISDNGDSPFSNKQLQFETELEQIQRIFQGTELDWFGSFN